MLQYSCLYLNSTAVYAETAKNLNKTKQNIDTRTTDFSRISEYKVNIKMNFIYVF